MSVTERRDGRTEGPLEDLARWPAGKHAGEGRAVEAGRPREPWPRGFQQRSSLLDIARDVVEVAERQQAPAAVPVEDHEVELVELHLEQLARGEGDQCQLADRRPVLLFRGA